MSTDGRPLEDAPSAEHVSSRDGVVNMAKPRNRRPLHAAVLRSEHRRSTFVRRNERSRSARVRRIERSRNARMHEQK